MGMVGPKQRRAIFVLILALAVIGLAFSRALLMPGGVSRNKLAMSLRVGSPMTAVLEGLNKKGFWCSIETDIGSPAAAATLLCYRYDSPDGAPNEEGTEVTVSSIDGNLVNFLIRPCGSLRKFTCRRRDHK
jgi:hypothetical protein